MTQKTGQRLTITLRQLEVFAATAREGSTQAAANRVARSQSAASAALGDLEKALGVALFDRVGRRLVLNEHGQALLPRAVSLLEQAHELVGLHATEHEAPLSLASSFTIGEYLMPDLIAQWRQVHPGSRVRLSIANTAEVLEAVASFDASVGFIEGTASHANLRIKRWCADELVVVAAPDHPLAGRAPTQRQLGEATWILREQGSGTREAADRWLSTHLNEYAVALELGSNEAIKRAARSGLGLACLSRHAVAGAVEEGWLVAVRTGWPAVRRSFSVVTHRARRLGSAAEDFVRHCLAATVDDPVPARRGKARRQRSR